MLAESLAPLHGLDQTTMGPLVSLGWEPGYPVAGYWLQETKRSQNLNSRSLTSEII